MTKTKKTLLTIGLSLLFMMLAGIYCSVNAMTSHAAATFEITSHTETDPTVLSGIYDETDATSADTIIAVDLNVSGMTANEMVNQASIVYDYDSTKFTPIFFSGTDDIYVDSYIQGLSVSTATNPTSISIVTFRASTFLVSSKFFTIYFKLLPSINPNTVNNPVTDLDTIRWKGEMPDSNNPEEMIPTNPPYVEPTIINYETIHVLIGDITGNGVVDTDDSVMLLQVLEDYSIQQASIATVAANLALWFPTLDAAEQVDTNGDGYFSQADVNNIMKYYSYAILHMGSYSGLAGTYYVFTRSI